MARPRAVGEIPEADKRFSTILARALQRQGLTLEQVAQRLEQAGTPVSQATLSYWQRGRALPMRESSLNAITELERILRLPVGHLIGSLPSDAFSRWQQMTSLSLSETADAVLEQLELDPWNDLKAIYVHDDIRLEADQRTQHEVTRELARCTRHGLQRTAFLMGIEGLGEECVPLVEPLAGCRLGRVIPLPETPLFVAELLLPRPLADGERHLRSLRVSFTSTRERHHGSLERTLLNPISYLALDLGFEGLAPSSVRYLTTPNQLPPEDVGDRLSQDLRPGRHVQLCMADPPSGWHRVEWEFETGAQDG